jgi:hypothetical protein
MTRKLGKKLGQTLLQHQKEQQEDRKIYKAMREASRKKENVLSMILDGMDQAKFKIPRVKGGTNFLGNNSWRPQLHVSDCIVHGYLDMYWVGDENIQKDANATVQQLNEALDAVATLRQTQNFPDHLVVQLDNTCRENKNNLIIRWAASLVGRGTFKTVSLHYLRKGHTHEDIDQRFKILSTLLSRATLLETPDDFRTLMTKSLPVPSGQSLRVVTMHPPYDWWQYYGNPAAFPYDVHGHTGPSAGHAFRLVRWTASDSQSGSSLLPSGAGNVAPCVPSPLQNGDVVLCVKHYMRDAFAAQPPVVIVPAAAVERLPSGIPKHTTRRVEMAKAQAKEYRKTAAACVRAPWNLHRAAAYLLDYVQAALDRYADNPIANPRIFFVCLCNAFDSP